MKEDDELIAALMVAAELPEFDDEHRNMLANAANPIPSTPLRGVGNEAVSTKEGNGRFGQGQ